MAGKDPVKILLVAVSAVLIINGLLSFYITGYVLVFQSQAVIYPPVQVVYTEFNGDTTNFSAFDEAGLSALTNLTLEVTGAGKVVFDGVTDLTQDKDTHNIIDIDYFADFSENSISIDTDALSSLAKSASVFMEVPGLASPVILVGGYECPPVICQAIDYSNGTLVFRVSQFTGPYSVVEEDVSPGPPSGPSGGVIPAAPLSNFSVDKDFIKVSVKQGETFLDSFAIENNGNTELDFSIEVEGLESNVALSDDSFVLAPGRRKTLTVAFTVLEDGHADVYTGRIRVTAGGITRTILLVMEVKEKRPLFDIFLSLENVPEMSLAGDVVEADILLYNFGDLMPVDVVLYYSLRDFEGNEILFKHDTVAVEEELDLKRSIRLPSDLKEGFYVFYSRVEYGNQTASSSGLIKVVSPEEMEGPAFMWELMALIAAVIAAIIVAVLLRPRYRRAIARKYDDVLPYLHVREKLRIARMSRERAEEMERKSRLERLEAEMREKKEREERIALEKMIDRAKSARKAERRKHGKG